MLSSKKSLFVQLSSFKKGVEVMTSYCIPKQIQSVVGCDVGGFAKAGRQLQFYRQLDNFVDLSYFYSPDVFLQKGWKWLYDNTLEFLKQYEVVYLFSVFMVEKFKFGDVRVFDFFLDAMKRSDVYGFNYTTAFQMYKYCIFLMAVRDSNCKAVQICLDPQEADLRAILGDGTERIYSLDGANTKFIPYYEIEERKWIGEIKTEKELEFMFKGTALTDDRKWLRDFASSVSPRDGFEFDVVGSRKSQGMKLLVNQSEYFYKLKQSKYTLVVPSYDKNSFSIQRFTDALFANCVPLVADTCCLDDLEWTFPEAYDLLLKSGWIVQIDKCFDRASCYNDDMRLVQQMLESLHLCLNEDEVLQEWRKLDV